MSKIFSRFVPRLRSKHWYHQRFDGSPFYIGVIAETEVLREKRKPAGTEADVRVCFFENGKADWYLDEKDIRRGSRAIVERAKHDPRIAEKLLHAWRRDEQAFQQFFDRFDHIQLQKLPDAKLWKLFQTYRAFFLKRFTSSSVIDHFALGTDQFIAAMLRREVGKLDKESQFTEIFSIATAPLHQSFINEAEMELLKIAINAPRDERRIRAYQQKYYWTKNNYFSSHVLSVRHFKHEIALWRSSGADLQKKLTQLQTAPARNKKEKAILFRRFHFSRLLRTLLDISEQFTWWQDERKRATYQCIHMGTRILAELARRKGRDPELTKYLLSRETAAWYRDGKPTDVELRNRQRACAYVVWRGGHRFFMGQQVETLRRTLFGTKRKDTVQDLRGLTASVGKVSGPVKVVGSVREVGKVEAGDILVAVMTRPDYIVGIKKAAAIVTNEGGITCHAAIISRELGIPCIIATKIATEVLRDGDVVEVNANHGVITILERKRI